VIVEPFHERGAALLLSIGILAVQVPATVGMVQQWETTPPWWSVLVVLGTATTLVLCLSAARGRGRVRWAALSHLVTVGAALLTLPWVWTGRFTEANPPWVSGYVTTAVAGSVLVFSAWWLSVMAGLTLVAANVTIQVQSAWVMPTERVLTDAVYHVMILAIALAVVLALTAAQAQLRAEADSAAASYARARATEQLTRRTAQWDALIHDEVLAALETIARAEDPAVVRAAARQAAASLVDPPGQGDVDATGLREELLQAVLTTYPLADTRFTPQVRESDVTVPRAVVEALSMAVSEALRNVAEHAYPAGEPGPATVDLLQNATTVVVTVTDRGRGFRRDQVRVSAFGLSLSIEQRMDAVGGLAQVISEPGAGTRVVLAWSQEGAR
jgi:signal transduction histidine kinase